MLAEWDGPAQTVPPCPCLEIRMKRCDDQSNTSNTNMTLDEGGSNAVDVNDGVPPTPPATKVSLCDQTTVADDSDDESAAEDNPEDNIEEIIPEGLRIIQTPILPVHPDALDLEDEIRDLIPAQKHHGLLTLRPPTLSRRGQVAFLGGVAAVAGYIQAHLKWRDLIREQIDLEGNLDKIPEDSDYHVALVDRKWRRTPLKAIPTRSRTPADRKEVKTFHSAFSLIQFILFFLLFLLFTGITPSSGAEETEQSPQTAETDNVVPSPNKMLHPGRKQTPVASTAFQ